MFLSYLHISKFWELLEVGLGEKIYLNMSFNKGRNAGNWLQEGVGGELDRDWQL